MGRSSGEVRTLEIEYTPLPSQKRFHDLDGRFKGFSGPIGSGKSQALCHEAIKLSYLNPGRLGLLGAPTYPMLRDATQATLLEILDGNDIPYDHNKAENILVMQDTGSRMLFRPVDEFERLRGTNLAWFGLDELTYTQEESWLRLQGRLRDPLANRLCGFAVWTPKGYDWVYQKFIAEPVQGYEVVMAAPEENHFLLDKIPDFYQRLKDSYDPKFYEQEVMGLYVSMAGGRVYSGFDRNQHIKKIEVDPGRTLYWALDFNVDPMSSVIVQIVRGKVLVVDEIVIRHATTDQACDEFMKRFPKHQADIVVYGDASGNQRQTTGLSDFQMVRDYFSVHTTTDVKYRVPKSNPSVRDRVNLVNRTMLTAGGDIHLAVDPKCKELIKDLEQVCFKAETNEIDKTRDRQRTHASDALGYLIWQECKPGKDAGEKNQPILKF
jgi:hypothetical protein